MSKFVCTVCGYVHEGDSAPEQCPVCKVGADKFKEQSGERVWASEHVVGVAKGGAILFAGFIALGYIFYGIDKLIKFRE